MFESELTTRTRANARQLRCDPTRFDILPMKRGCGHAHAPAPALQQIVALRAASCWQCCCIRSTLEPHYQRGFSRRPSRADWADVVVHRCPGNVGSTLIGSDSIGRLLIIESERLSPNRTGPGWRASRARTWGILTSASTSGSSPRCHDNDQFGMVKLTPDQQATIPRKPPERHLRPKLAPGAEAGARASS